MFSYATGIDFVGVVLLFFAMLVYIAGFVWIRSITSLDEEKPSSWRYLRARVDADALAKSFVRDPAVAKAPPQPQDPRDLIDAVFAESWRRARRGRMIARLIFALDLIAGPILFIAASNLGEPRYSNYSDPASNVLLLVAVPWLIGLAWMWRILRADSRPDPSARRYRDF
jgi:hypothetical protein